MAEPVDITERFGAAEGAAVAVCLCAFVLLGAAALALPEVPAVLAQAANDTKATTGLGNTVNGVLMNIRAFETMMEKAVVLLALTGVFVLGPGGGWMGRPGNFPVLPPPEPELSLLLRALVPLSVLTAVYLLWTGADHPGGAFQGGTVLAGVAVLLVISGTRPAPGHGTRGIRGLAAAGVGAFLLAGAACLPWTQGFLDYPPALAKAFVIVIEAGLLVSVGALLFLLAGGAPVSDGLGERVP
ncbi:MAG: Na(+)/H(+) antiporter subunit B [Alphaproteobacteria bacterium]